MVGGVLGVEGKLEDRGGFSRLKKGKKGKSEWGVEAEKKERKKERKKRKKKRKI